MAPRALRISHVGLRGVTGNGLTAQHAIDFALAFGTFLDSPGRVVIGRDTRASGRLFREAVLGALMACGHDVVDLGAVSTPVIQHAMRRMAAGGGISIGASHNPEEWNALKFLGRDAAYLSTAEATELLDIYHLRHFRYATYRELGRLSYDADAIDAYLAELAPAFDFDRLRAFRVVVDCCNGTSALVLRRLNEAYGFRFILINAATEGGRFAHEPSTNARTVGLQLAPLIEPLNAHAGFLFDADSDRVAMATERGEAVSEEMMLPLIAEHVLPRSEGRTVITNLSTTALVDEVVRRHDGAVVRAPVGRQATIDALSAFRPGQVALAGEGTGAIMFARFPYVYDGIAAMLTVLEMMAGRDQPLSQLLAVFPRYSMLKGEVPVATTRLPGLLMSLQEEYSSGRIDTTDGLRIEWPDHWFHVRAAQTEPLLRVICEQRGDAPRALFDSLMDRARSLA
jgi:phosphomannomutase